MKTEEQAREDLFKRCVTDIRNKISVSLVLGLGDVSSEHQDNSIDHAADKIKEVSQSPSVSTFSMFKGSSETSKAPKLSDKITPKGPSSKSSGG